MVSAHVTLYMNRSSNNQEENLELKSEEAIFEKLLQKYRHLKIEFLSEIATETRLFQSLNSPKRSIVHFSGHGISESLVLESNGSAFNRDGALLRMLILSKRCND